MKALPRELQKTPPVGVAAALKQPTSNATHANVGKSPLVTLKPVELTLPSNKFLKLAGSLPKNRTSLLIQLRSGHAPLIQHLFRLRKVESALCSTCGNSEETVSYYLRHCPT